MKLTKFDSSYYEINSRIKIFNFLCNKYRKENQFMRLFRIIIFTKRDDRQVAAQDAALRVIFLF